MTTIASSKDAMAQAKTRMEKAVEDFRQELSSVRTGRANVSLLEPIRVDYHGTPMPLQQLGTISVPDPMMLVIAPWDPTVLPAIDKAIRTAELGLNPMNDGKVVRVPIPALTEDRRKEMVKHLHKMLENHRTAVRNIRRDIKEAVEHLEKDKKISEDERKRSIDELEKLTQSETKKIEDLCQAKERDVHEGIATRSSICGQVADSTTFRALLNVGRIGCRKHSECHSFFCFDRFDPSFLYTYVLSGEFDAVREVS